METTVRDVKRSSFCLNAVRQKQLLLQLCLCGLLGCLLTNPAFVEGNQSSIAPAQSSGDQGKGLSARPLSIQQKDSSQARLTSQESKPVQQRNPTSKSEVSNPKGEEGTDKEKDGAGKRTVSSLILTVKLALLADTRLFPYDIEVETKSDEVLLSGKVSNEAEKSIATEIARSIPGVKSVVNNIEIVKELPDVLAHRQDDIVTQQVKERFARSATLKAASFDVKTEGGVVTLGGSVRFQVFILEAAEAARQVPGVKAVRTHKVRIESEG
jgi:hyperosmotically inducible protein